MFTRFSCYTDAHYLSLYEHCAVSNVILSACYDDSSSPDWAPNLLDFKLTIKQKILMKVEMSRNSCRNLIIYGTAGSHDIELAV